MLTWEQARRAVVEAVTGARRQTETETVEVAAALGRVLAEVVVADRDLPPFPRALRDGYAVRAADGAQTPARLQLAGEVRPGRGFAAPLQPGQAVRIMTGASVPDGADAVVPVEQAREENGVVVLESAPAVGQHITRRGAEATAGQHLLSAGQRLGFAELAVLAMVGHQPVRVTRLPRVALLATGDELVALDQTPGPYQIRDANTAALAALILLSGGAVECCARLADNAGGLERAFRTALEGCDVLVASGGVSAGRYDMVRAVLEQLGARIVFHGVRMRPGRPTLFALLDGRPVFGLPGNPISAMLACELFVVPALDILAGAQPRPLAVVRARLEQAVAERGAMTHFLPARLEWRASGLSAAPVGWQGSGDAVAASRADGFLIVPAERLTWQPGEEAQVLLRRDRL